VYPDDTHDKIHYNQVTGGSNRKSEDDLRIPIARFSPWYFPKDKENRDQSWKMLALNTFSHDL
jgi:hypothetical protein